MMNAVSTPQYVKIPEGDYRSTIITVVEKPATNSKNLWLKYTGYSASYT